MDRDSDAPPPSAPRLQAVVAMASNRVIGRDGDLPWRLPEDLRWFKRLTLGHPVLMGRRTMESLPRALPGRRNLVVSRQMSEAPPGFELAPDCETALARLAGETLVSVIGGAQIYRELMPRCGEVYLSYVYEPHEGDTRLAPFEEGFRLEEVLHRDEDFELRRYRRIE